MKLGSQEILSFQIGMICKWKFLKLEKKSYNFKIELFKIRQQILPFQIEIVLFQFYESRSNRTFDFEMIIWIVKIFIKQSNFAFKATMAVTEKHFKAKFFRILLKKYLKIYEMRNKGNWCFNYPT